MSSTHRFHNVAANRSPKGFDLLGAVDPVAGLDGLSELAEHLRSSGRVEICSTTRQDSTDSTHHRTLGEIGNTVAEAVGAFEIARGRRAGVGLHVQEIVLQDGNGEDRGKEGKSSNESQHAESCSVNGVKKADRFSLLFCWYYFFPDNARE
jgi:hypothetical protein